MWWPLVEHDKEMLRQVAETFGFAVDADLDVMRPIKPWRGSPPGSWMASTARSSAHPGRRLVQGDTTTVLVASLASSTGASPIGHVEAGLRTGNIWSPFPRR